MLRIGRTLTMVRGLAHSAQKSWLFTVRLIIISIFAVSAAACGQERDKADPEPKTPPKPAVQVKIPQFELTDTLAGIDDNHNGIRDDIEKFIDGLDVTPPQREALKKVAKSLSATLLVDLNNEEELYRVSTMEIYALDCALKRFRSAGNIDEGRHYLSILRAANANTLERTKSYIAYNVALSGRVFSMPIGDVCDEEL